MFDSTKLFTAQNTQTLLVMRLLEPTEECTEDKADINNDRS
jgi:hypothetical protein